MEELYIEPNRSHHRLETFVHKGLACICCGELGTRFVESVDNGGGIHLDIYSEDWTLINVDHTIPKCEGGTDELSNKEPMCQDCNQFKGRMMVDIPTLRNLIAEKVLHFPLFLFIMKT